MRNKILPTILLSALILASCFREETWEPNTWTHHFQGPIAKTNLDLEALTNLQEIRFVDNILASEVNALWDGPVLVPAITNQSSEKNPQIFEMTEYFKAIHTDSLIVKVDFTNGYPIEFGKGTELVFRNQENQDEFFRHALVRPVAPGEEYTFNIEILTAEDNPQKVETNIEFYLDNFRSSGTEGEIRDFTGASTNFAFTIEFLSVLKLELYPDKEWGDTTKTVITLFEDGTEEQKIVEAKIGLKLVNGLPINGLAFIDILNSDDEVVGSIFKDTLVITPATIDPNTLEVLNKTEVELEIDLPFETLNHFYNNSKLKIMYEMNTNGIPANELVLGEEASLKAKVKADAKLYVDEIEITE
ncbi:MAG: hypothetical protein ACPGLV_00380 [Bacteroidia bacterium]